MSTPQIVNSHSCSQSYLVCRVCSSLSSESGKPLHRMKAFMLSGDMRTCQDSCSHTSSSLWRNRIFAYCQHSLQGLVKIHAGLGSPAQHRSQGSV